MTNKFFEYVYQKCNKRLTESQCSGDGGSSSIASGTPENVTDVLRQDEKREEFFKDVYEKTHKFNR